eukprot:2894766-Amphidinium_carterae.2
MWRYVGENARTPYLRVSCIRWHLSQDDALCRLQVYLVLVAPDPISLCSTEDNFVLGSRSIYRVRCGGSHEPLVLSTSDSPLLCSLERSTLNATRRITNQYEFAAENNRQLQK